MLPKVIALSGFIATAFACFGHYNQEARDHGVGLARRSETYPKLDPGNDTPADPKTTGYFVNHLALNVRDMNQSIKWYGEVFGLRLIFQFHLTAKVSIAYLGHSHGGRNGTGFQTALELSRQRNNIEGLVELVYFADRAADIVPSTAHTNTFSHFGLVVPDIQAAQARFEKLGVNILRKVGETGKLQDPLAESLGVGGLADRDPAEAEKVLQALLGAGGRDFIFIADPDGNMIEVQSLYTPPLEW